METQFAVLTALGKDRIGIVDELSRELVETHCNIEESKMARLGGEFAVIMLVSGNENDLAHLQEDFAAWTSQQDLKGNFVYTEAPSAVSDGRPYLVESVSLDTPGILHSVTTLIRNMGINIEDLETETVPAPWTGAPMFQMRARITLPRDIQIKVLKTQLENLGNTEDLDIQVHPIIPGAED